MEKYVQMDNQLQKNSFLLPSEWVLCTEPQQHQLGPYRSSRNVDSPFTIEVDATPLAVLAESAAMGCRVYELMAIRRPGDLLRYFRVRMTDASEDVMRAIATKTKDRFRYTRDAQFKTLSIVDYDNLYYMKGDDTRREDELWVSFRMGFNSALRSFFEMALVWQTRLALKDDYLIQHELSRIHQHQHHQDYASEVSLQPYVLAVPQTQTTFPAALFAKLKSLLNQDHVKSVTYTLHDYAFLRLLIETQVRRAKAQSISPRSALFVCGTDGWRPSFVDELDWGGHIHYPYEGIVECDIYFKPECLKFHFSKMKFVCKYMLSQEDFGEQEGTTRTVFDDWFFYEYNGINEVRRAFEQ